MIELSADGSPGAGYLRVLRVAYPVMLTGRAASAHLWKVGAACTACDSAEGSCQVCDTCDACDACDGECPPDCPSECPADGACASACDACDAEGCAQCNNETSPCPTDPTEPGSCAGEGGCASEQHCPSECPSDGVCASDCPSDGGCGSDCPSDCPTDCPSDGSTCEADGGTCDLAECPTDCPADPPAPVEGCSTAAWQDANCDLTVGTTIATLDCLGADCSGTYTWTKIPGEAGWGQGGSGGCLATLSCVGIGAAAVWRVRISEGAKAAVWEKNATETGADGCPAGTYTLISSTCTGAAAQITVA